MIVMQSICLCLSEEICAYHIPPVYLVRKRVEHVVLYIDPTWAFSRSPTCWTANVLTVLSNCSPKAAANKDNDWSNSLQRVGHIFVTSVLFD